METLTYSYLGDWINRQKDGVKRNEDGAEDRLAAAVELQKRLIAILEGDPPFDIFVRWKPVEKQPVGWNPDINDGVRINIRPFMASDIPGGKSGAGVLRWKPNISWSKDRGKEPDRSKEQFPWFWKNGEFTGDRINDVHIANSVKLKARERAAGDPEVDINV
ncbi:MAG: Putative s-adenosyl-L-methionine-dependent methyltransferase [Desulfotomaculum sp. 46_296]|nr:MAG: Putative s-adenosyl-L-methionine-dependent methyltransferase [Desulfotomaculum sp. 46_296]